MQGANTIWFIAKNVVIYKDNLDKIQLCKIDVFEKYVFWEDIQTRNQPLFCVDQMNDRGGEKTMDPCQTLEWCMNCLSVKTFTKHIENFAMNVSFLCLRKNSYYCKNVYYSSPVSTCTVYMWFLEIFGLLLILSYLFWRIPSNSLLFGYGLELRIRV